MVQGRDEDEGIAQHIPPGTGEQQTLMRQNIGVGLIRKKQEVGRRAGPELPREGARGGEVEDDFVARLRFVRGGEGLEGIGEAGGGEDRDGGGGGWGGRKQESNGGEMKARIFQGRKFKSTPAMQNGTRSGVHDLVCEIINNMVGVWAPVRRPGPEASISYGGMK